MLIWISINNVGIIYQDRWNIILKEYMNDSELKIFKSLENAKINEKIFQNLLCLLDFLQNQVNFLV